MLLFIPPATSSFIFCTPSTGIIFTVQQAIYRIACDGVQRERYTREEVGVGENNKKIKIMYLHYRQKANEFVHLTAADCEAIIVAVSLKFHGQLG